MKSRPHCYVCQRWDGTHSTGCNGKYIGIMLGCNAHGAWEADCSLCATRTDTASRNRAIELAHQSHGGAAGSFRGEGCMLCPEEPQRDEREYHGSGAPEDLYAQPISMEPGAIFDVMTGAAPANSGGRYDVDRENDLLRAIRGASLADLEALAELADLGATHPSTSVRAFLIKIWPELRARTDELAEEQR